MLLGIRWYQFVRNDDVRRLTKQPKVTAIIQSRRLTLFGHIMRMDDNTDAKGILLASPLADWRRQSGRPCITRLSTVQQDLKQHHLTLHESADLAQNRRLWMMMSTYSATQSWVAHQKRRRLSFANKLVPWARNDQIWGFSRSEVKVTRSRNMSNLWRWYFEYIWADFATSLAMVAHMARAWSDQLPGSGGQSSRSQKAVVGFVGLAEASWVK